MKKKNIKTFNLNKKTISKFEKDAIKGGITDDRLCTFVITAFTYGVSLAVCDDDDTFDSCNCITDNNEHSCVCGIA
ncbi:hypothetical protein [Kordia sp.]|uniref:hypothetical protein n=1 Tax=Kordia sp. TaxID=1965332 RepID=UPI003B5CDF36